VRSSRTRGERGAITRRFRIVGTPRLPQSLSLIRIAANCCELVKVANERGRLGNRCHLIDRRCSHPHDYLAHKHIRGRNEGPNVDPLRTGPSRREIVGPPRSKVHYAAEKGPSSKQSAGATPVTSGDRTESRGARTPNCFAPGFMRSATKWPVINFSNVPLSVYSYSLAESKKLGL